MKKILVALALFPLAAFAQGAGPTQGTGPGGAGQGGPRGPNPEMMEKRARLARTLGLAVTLDLEPAQALKLGEAISKFDDRRMAARKQMRDAHDVLHRAAHGEKVEAAAVDQAIQRGLEARGQLQAIDKETIAVVTQGLTPEKKARAVLFLAKFQSRFGHRHGPGGPGMGGPGQMHGPGMHGPGRGMGGPGGPGMGPGMGGMAHLDAMPMDDGGGFGEPDATWGNDDAEE